jgi:S-adenosylmethionine hydrolase
MVITLLTDYGWVDEFAGVCHAVIRTICDCPVIDLTHGIPRHDVRRGAIVLRNALPYAPAGVHVAVVDPEVGSERRAVAVRCEGERLLVGPDNGLLSLAWERFGGVLEAVDVSRSPHRLEPVAATFHGRDLFAPVAAHLARGAELAEAGELVDPDELVTIDLPAPRAGGGALRAHVLYVDGFGNAGLDAAHADLAGTGLELGRAIEVEARGERREARLVRSFADVPPGELLVYEDAYRVLAVAVNRGDAAAELGLRPDDELVLRPL